MFGFGVGQDFLMHTVAPGTAERILICLVSKLKAEVKALRGEARSKAPRRGGHWSASGVGGERESLSSNPHRTHDPAVLWGHAGMTDSSGNPDICWGCLPWL